MNKLGQIAAVGIIGFIDWQGNDNVMLYEILREGKRQFGWAEGEPFFSFLFIYHWTDYHTDTGPVICRKIIYLYKNQYYFKKIIP